MPSPNLLASRLWSRATTLALLGLVASLLQACRSASSDTLVGRWVVDIPTSADALIGAKAPPPRASGEIVRLDQARYAAVMDARFALSAASTMALVLAPDGTAHLTGPGIPGTTRSTWTRDAEGCTFAAWSDENPMTRASISRGTMRLVVPDPKDETSLIVLKPAARSEPIDVASVQGTWRADVAASMRNIEQDEDFWISRTPSTAMTTASAARRLVLTHAPEGLKAMSLVISGSSAEFRAIQETLYTLAIEPMPGCNDLLLLRPTPADAGLLTLERRADTLVLRGNGADIVFRKATTQ